MARAELRSRKAARAEGIAIAREIQAAVAGLDRVVGVHVGTPAGDLEAALAVLSDAHP
jgi:hypothetical protein